MKHILVGVIIALIVIGSCAPSLPEVEGLYLAPIETHKLARTGIGHRLMVYELNDGTRCAVYRGTNGRGGISCDWR